jgi:hypothetical protein
VFKGKACTLPSASLTRSRVPRGWRASFGKTKATPTEPVL